MNYKIISQILFLAVITNIASATNRKDLLIVDDFDSVTRCKSIADINSVADILKSAKPTIIAVDAASPDLCSYPTKIGKPREYPNRELLTQAGIDPYRELICKFRSSNIVVLANIRMNDHHGQAEAWAPWEQEHKNWSLGKDTGDRSWSAIGKLRQMDYAIKGVREYRLEIIKEILANYPVDGIQLDFGRTAPFLSEPKCSKAKYLTEFVSGVRKLIESISQVQHRKMVLGIIVPWDVNFCDAEGLDIREWIQQGLTDYICPGEWFYADYNMDIESWHKLTTSSKCKLYPMVLGDMAPARISSNMSQKGNMPMLGEESHLTGARISAFAELFYSEGADGLLFYNFYTYQSYFKKLYPDLRRLIDANNLPTLEREYFYCRKLKYDPTEAYTFKTGEAFAYLTLDKQGDAAEYRFHCGSNLSNSKCVFKFKMKNAAFNDKARVVLNSAVVEPSKIEFLNYTDIENNSYRVAIWQKLMNVSDFKLSENGIRISLVSADPGRREKIDIGEFQIQICQE